MKLKEITIELTQQCPNCCVYCSSLSSPVQKTFLTADKIEEAISDAVSLGAKSISLSGGEPFLYPEFCRIVDFIHQQKVSCNIYTSGIILQDGKPVSITEELLEAIKGKIDKLVVNVEAAEERVYDQIMGTSFGGFQMLKNSIRKAVTKGIQVEAHVVPMKLNIQQLPKIISLCDELGISRVSFLRLVVQGRALSHQSDILLDDDEIKFAKYLIAISTKQYQGSIRFGIPFGDCVNRVNCMTGISKLNIRYDGFVYPCEAFKDNRFKNKLNISPDNIINTGLKDIYNHSSYLMEMRNSLAYFQTIDTCETCMAQFFKNLKYNA